MLCILSTLQRVWTAFKQRMYHPDNVVAQCECAGRQSQRDALLPHHRRRVLDVNTNQHRVKEGDKRKYIPQFKSPNTLLTSTSPTDKKEKSLKITVKRYKNDDEGIARVQKNSKERVNPNEADV